MTRTTGRRALPCLLALVLGIGACALPSDDSPQAIDDSRIDDVMAPTSTSTTSTTSLTQTRPRDIYFYDEDGILVADERDLPINASVAEVLDQLTRAPERGDLATNVPAETVFEATEVSESGTLTITVPEDSELFGEGASQIIRTVAQIVVTATQLDRVEDVRFQIVDEEDVLRVPSETRGDTNSPLTACDYPSFVGEDSELLDDCPPTSTN